MFSVQRIPALSATAIGARVSRAGFVSRRVLPNRKDAALEMSSGWNLPLLSALGSERLGFPARVYAGQRAGWLIPANAPTPRSIHRVEKLAA
jgi:hypothetical protein